MRAEAAEIARNGGGNGDGPSPTGKTRLPQPTDAGLAALLRASQGFGAAGIRLLTQQNAVESRTSLAVVVSVRSSGKCRLIHQVRFGLRFLNTPKLKERYTC